MRWAPPGTCAAQHVMPPTPLVRRSRSRTSRRTSLVRPPMRSKPRGRPCRQVRVISPGDWSAGGSATTFRRQFARWCSTTSGCGTTSAGRYSTAEHEPAWPAGFPSVSWRGRGVVQVPDGHQVRAEGLQVSEPVGAGVEFLLHRGPYPGNVGVAPLGRCLLVLGVAVPAPAGLTPHDVVRVSARGPDRGRGPFLLAGYLLAAESVM